MGSERTVMWVSCYHCSGDMFIDEASVASLAVGGWSSDTAMPGEGPIIYCRKCKPIVDREQAARAVAKNSQCVHVMLPRGPFSDLYVKAVEGEFVVVGCLGLNGVDPERFEAILGTWWPAGMRVPSRQAGRSFRFRRSELLMKGI